MWPGEAHSLKRKRNERNCQFAEVLKQINSFKMELAGSTGENLDIMVIDEFDLSMKGLDDLRNQLLLLQEEKVLPRTVPGHPALDEDGRNALRHLLTAYARHNPSVGYCQAMNFFAGMLLLLMPVENAFWSLMGILDDYFESYYSEEMLESQVDQLVLEELVRERFPKLVEVAWITGPWFLTIFMNMLPWESVLRVWDVLLFEGNRAMLFRTALALMELFGPALVTTKDAGDAVTLLQSLAGSTFDSSQLVFTACMVYQNVQETRLEELRNKHRSAVKAALEERSKGVKVPNDSQVLASKLFSFKKDPSSMTMGSDKQQTDMHINGDMSHLDSLLVDVDDLWLDIEHTVGKKYCTWDKMLSPYPEGVIVMNMVKEPPEMNDDMHKDSSEKEILDSFFVKMTNEQPGGDSTFDGKDDPATEKQDENIAALDVVAEYLNLKIFDVLTGVECGIKSCQNALRIDSEYVNYSCSQNTELQKWIGRNENLDISSENISQPHLAVAWILRNHPRFTMLLM